ncbi:MAG: helix-turn-helix transcriptional regulator [Pseudomonadales bacterium]|nr:helix-turn-helix transcriptional regulator [Pseudomonadales bacterium]
MKTLVSSNDLPANAFSAKCPARTVLDRLAGKWTILIVDALRNGPLRYRTLHRRIEGVSQKMLTQTLRSLEEDGLVVRTEFPTKSPKVEYRLTELGRSLSEPISAIRVWAEQHINEIIEARSNSEHLKPGS